MSEKIVKMIIQIKSKQDEADSFLKNKSDSNEITRIISKKIIVVFLLKAENASKFPKIKTA